MKNTVRIIGGEFKGTRLRVPTVKHLRPTSGRNREMLFNWLGPQIVDARVLDLFAGTGALGLEALSRGASSVDFIESNRKVIRLLEENVNRLKLRADQVSITCKDTLRWLKRVERQWDFILLDPPFHMVNLYGEILGQLSTKLKSSGLIYVEHNRRNVIDYHDFSVWKSSTVGEVCCVLLQKSVANVPSVIDASNAVK
ncbi:MAG: 16S rRNA (guanine(966)-N(2))-methyltransferase RsmD [Gammaproteobacteria bacterium]|nr:16S rRNA (guanine(966)-N(2))-methyltransferase RsmD [Gammaproteobacteria bacterium]